MEKDFIPSEEALELKALGFDKPCFGTWIRKVTGEYSFSLAGSRNSKDWDGSRHCAAPTFSQAFRWFREKCELDSFIRKIIGTDGEKLYCYEIFKTKLSSSYNSYEEAELACLDKLIEIVKSE